MGLLEKMGQIRKNVLILGSRGYLGQNIRLCLEKEENLEVRGFDPIDCPTPVHQDLGWCDLCILALGLSDHAMGQKNPIKDYDRNLADYLEVLRHVDSAGKKFLYLGSLCQYGQLQGDISETTPLNPIEPQGLNKAYIEKVLEFLAELGSLSFCALRLGAVVGKKKELLNLSLLEKIIKTNIDGKRFEVHGGATRCYSCIPMDTFLEIIIAIIEKDHFNNRAYNLSTHNICFGDLSSWLDIKFSDTKKQSGHTINSDRLFAELNLEVKPIPPIELISCLRHEISELRHI